MVSWADVKKWDPATIGAVADKLKKHRDTLVGLEHEVSDAAPPSDWVGEAARAARNKLGEHERRLEEIVAEISAAFAGTAEAETRAESLARDRQRRGARRTVRVHNHRIRGGGLAQRTLVERGLRRAGASQHGPSAAG